MKRRPKLLLYVALICGVPLLLITLLHAPPVRRYALKQLRDYLRDSQGIDLTAASLRYNLVTLSAEFEQLSLRSTAAADLPPFASVGFLRARLGFLSLLQGHPLIRDASLEGIKLDLFTDPQGRVNIPFGAGNRKPPSEEGAPIPLEIIRLDARDGSFRFVDNKSGTRIELPLWKLEIRGKTSTQAHVIRFQMQKAGHVTVEGRPLTLAALDLEAELDPRFLEVKRLTLEAGESRIQAEGILEDFSGPRANLNVSADLNVGRLAEIAGIEEELQGRVQAHATVTGPIAKLLVMTRISGKDLKVRNISGIDVTGSARWDAGSRRVYVESADVRLPFGSLSGQASIALAEHAEPSTATLQIEELDLESATRRLGLPVGIASHVTGKAQARWKGMELGQADASADLRFSAARTRPVRDVFPVSASISGMVRGNLVALDIRSCEVLGSRVQGRVTLRSLRDLDGELLASLESLERSVNGLEAFLGREAGSLIPTRLDGPLRVHAQLDGTVTSPLVAAELSGPATEIGVVRDVVLEGSARYHAGHIVLESASASWKDQTLTADGEVDFGGKSPLFNLNARLRRGSLASIAAGLGKDIPIEGSFELDTAIRGTAAEVDLSTSLSLSELRAYGETLGNLTLRADLKGSRLELRHLELVKPSPSGETGHLTATAGYDLDSRAYSLKSHASGLRFTGLTLPGGLAVRGTLDLTAEGAGSLDDPSLNAKLDLTGLEVGGHQVGEASLAGRVERQETTLEVRLPRFKVASNALVGTRFPYPARFEIEAATDLSMLGIELPEGEPVEGSIVAIVKGSGDIARWQDGSASVLAERLLLKIRGKEIRNQGAIDIAYQNRRLVCRPAQLLSGDSSITVSGSLPVETGAAPEVLNASARVSLADLIGFIPAEQRISATGILSVDAMLRGRLREIDPAVSLSVREGSFDHPGLSVGLKDVGLDAEYRDGVLSVKTLAAAFGGASVRAEGEIPIGSVPLNLPLAFQSRPGLARFYLLVDGLQLSAFNEIPEAVAGTISFHLEGETTRTDDLQALRVKAVFDQLRLRTAEYEIGQAAPVQLSLAGATVTIDQFLLTGPATHVSMEGTAALAGEQLLDLRLRGDINAGIAALLSEGFQTAGAGRFELALGGRLSAPELTGFLEIEQGQFNMPDPRIAARNLSVRLRLASGDINIERFAGDLNGGELSISGRVGYDTPGFLDLNVDASVKDAYLDYPEGLRTEVSADLALRSEGEFVVLGGEAHILQGSYRRPLDLTGEVMSYLRSGGAVQPAEQDPFLSRLRFNVQVDTQGPLLIDNNLAKLVANGNLRLVGTYLRPGLLGRISLEEGGKLYFQERTYLIERGLVSFFNEAKIEPDLDVLATTRAGEYDISLSLTGTPEKFSADLSSTPSLSQPDIIAVLMTGRKLEELRGSGLNVARRQVQAYLSGQLAGFLSRGAEETLGLSMVRIDPSLINPETDPGARLTVGEDVTRNVRLVYSMNLVDASDQILTAQYDVTRRFQTEMTRQSDNTYRFDFRHGLQFGGSAGTGDTAAGSTTERKIGRVELLGEAVFSADQVLDRIGLKSGDKYDFFKVQKGVERLRRYYHDRNRLECRIDVETRERDGLADLSVHVEAGPELEVVYEGLSPPKDLRRSVSAAWQEGLFDAQRTQDAVEAVRRSLVQQGCLQAKVEVQVSFASPGRKQVLITADAGPRFRGVTLEFEGASGIDPSRLRKLLDSGELITDIHLSPAKVKDLLERYYRQEGYLDAKVGDPRYDLNPESGTGKIVIPIEEGLQFSVRKLEFSGNKALEDPQLRAALPFAAGSVYRPELLQTSLGKLEEIYWADGYNDAAVNYTVNRAPESNEVDVGFQIAESRQQVVDRIEIEGNRATSESMVRSQMALSPGDILEYGKTGQSRRRLYETNAYTLVDIQALPAGTPQPLTAGNQDPVTLKVKLKEVRPFELRYGGFYDTERGPGAIASFSNRNSLGSARLVGVRTRYDSDVHELRGYFSQPFLRRFPVDTNVTGFFRREITRGQDTPDSGFITDRTGFTLQQEARFRDNLILSYGYRFQRNHTYDMGPDPFFDITLKTAPLVATLTRDTRDDFLDASRGSFLSQAFEYAPSFLGSDLRFVKYLGQYFHYLPLSGPAEVPWAGTRRSRLVFAGAVRVGLASGLGGQDLILSDKFFAGGGTTIRGFGQNEVGPRDFFGDPAGGNALLIMNGELRFPLFSIFDGVGFLDLGNVYPRIGDFDPTSVRKSSGFGLRLRTPYFLLRADYGFKLDRRPGESLGKFFFSIGQAF